MLSVKHDNPHTEGDKVQCAAMIASMMVNKGPDAKKYIFEESCGWTINAVSLKKIKSEWLKNKKAKERKMKAKVVARVRAVNKQNQFCTTAKQRLAAEAAEDGIYVPGKKATRKKVKSLIKSFNKKK